MTKAVIFDMDGILLDTESVCNLCWKRAGEEFGIKDTDIAIKKCIGLNVNDTMNVLAEFCGSKEKAEIFHNRTSELFHIIEREQGLNKMPYVDECLSELKKRGFRLAVASSTRWENVERQLKAAGLFDYFETITTGDKVEHSKPAPDIYLKALASLNLNAEDCIAVEDSPNGIRSATDAKIRCVMVPDQIPPNEELKKLTYKILNSLNELVNVIE